MKKRILLITLITISFGIKAQITELSNGNVGIGTTSPSKKLHIGANNNEGILIGRYNDRLNWSGSGIQPSYHIDFAGYRDIVPDVIGARISAIRTNSCCNALAQGMELAFYVSSRPENRGDNDLIEAIRIDSNSNVGIGTTNPGTWKLSVNGQIRAKEIKVETGWSDFVFEKDYNLPTLIEVENHIKEKGHLKDIPSAKEVKENGIFLGEMDSKLLQKIEELTLYIISQEKKLKLQNLKIKKLEKENKSFKLLTTKFLELQKRLEKLEQR